MPHATAHEPPAGLRARRGDPDHWTSILALVWVAAAGEVFGYVTPFLLGAMVEHFGGTEGAISFVVTAQVLAISAAAAGVATWLPRLNLRAVAGLGLLVIFIADVLTATTDSAQVLVASRVLAGLGEGSCMSAAAAMAARTSQPDRTFGLVLIGVVLVVIAVFTAIPPLTNLYGAPGAFWAMAAVAVVAAPFLGWVVEAPATAMDPARTTVAAARVGPGEARVLTFCFLSFLAFSLLWIYVERIGQAAGLSLEAIARIMTLSGFLALAGPAVALGIGSRYGRTRPFAVACGVAATCGLLMTHAQSAAVFALSSIAINVLYLFAVPFLRAATAQMDPSGRLTAAAGAAAGASLAAGPALGGALLLLGTGYSGIGRVGALSFVAALVVVWPVFRQLDADSAR